MTNLSPVEFLAHNLVDRRKASRTCTVIHVFGIEHHAELTKIRTSGGWQRLCHLVHDADKHIKPESISAELVKGIKLAEHVILKSKSTDKTSGKTGRIPI